MEHTDKSYIAKAQQSFAKGYKLGKLIPHHDFDLLQKQFALRALNRDSNHYYEFRAISLGYDTALLERGLIEKKVVKPIFRLPIQDALKAFKDIDEKSKDQSDDLSLDR